LSNRREEILEVTKGIIASKGIRDASMREIADASGLLAGSLYSHFRSKSHLIELIIEPFFQAVLPGQQAALAGAGTGADALEDMVRRVFPVLLHHADEVTILHYDWPQMLEMPELAHLVEESNQLLELWLAAATRAVDDGSLRPGIDPEVLVRMINSAMFSLIDRQRYGTFTNALDRVGPIDLTDEVVSVFVTGLRSSGPARRPKPTAKKPATKKPAAAKKAPAEPATAKKKAVAKKPAAAKKAAATKAPAKKPAAVKRAAKRR
jgi:AcrR family transcriptional regulator